MLRPYPKVTQGPLCRARYVTYTSSQFRSGSSHLLSVTKDMTLNRGQWHPLPLGSDPQGKDEVNKPEVNDILKPSTVRCTDPQGEVSSAPPAWGAAQSYLDQVVSQPVFLVMSAFLALLSKIPYPGSRAVSLPAGSNHTLCLSADTHTDPHPLVRSPGPLPDQNWCQAHVVSKRWL